MQSSQVNAVVETRRQLCRMCYTCVRECPSKAIRVLQGQAELVPERCVGCGNCVQVCTQHAKQVVSSIARVEALFHSGRKIAACIAPSFPAEFVEMDDRSLIGMLHALGFQKVAEVALGAELVSRRYKGLVEGAGEERYIATTCPAIVGYVEKYHPGLVPALATIVSPMIATARAFRSMYGADWEMVFIGPCIAKKLEAEAESLSGEIAAAITFQELREMFTSRKLEASTISPGDFATPPTGLGAIYALSRGMLQSSKLTEDLVTGRVVATKGRSNFLEALSEFEKGDLNASLLEILCCKGCIMGPGMTGEKSLYKRRSIVSEYVKRRLETYNAEEVEAGLARFTELDLSRTFKADDQRLMASVTGELGEILKALGKLLPEDELNCGACGYDTCRDHAAAISKGLAEVEMCLPHTVSKLRDTIGELEHTHSQLADTQQALLQSEKLASMGQLAAGIAHEVNNPLGVVLMYAHLLLEECGEGGQVREDLKVITEQANRCKKIVSGLLHFARQNRVLRQRVDLRVLVAQSLLCLASSPGIDARVDHRLDDPFVEVDGDQIVQVLINLLTNSSAAMPEGGSILLTTEGTAEQFTISVRDSGTGIAPDIRKKIFEPFFTTRQIGKGTGLGLAVTYGIVKMHRGEISLDSNSDPAIGPTWTKFSITLPRKEQGDDQHIGEMI